MELLPDLTQLQTLGTGALIIVGIIVLYLILKQLYPNGLTGGKTDNITNALDSYFNRENPPKFINTDRIPLICQDVSNINKTLIRLENLLKEKTDDHELRIRDVEKEVWKK